MKRIIRASSRIFSPEVTDEERKVILWYFRLGQQNVLSTYEDTDRDGDVTMQLFVVECDNTNSLHISELEGYLNRLEDEYGIGYETVENDNGFYGRNYIFYHYVD